MPSLNFNQITKAYRGTQLLDKVYHGSKQVFPVIIPKVSYLYYRFDYNSTLSEVQFKFEGESDFTVLNSSNGITFERSNTFSSSSSNQQNTGALNDGTLGINNSQYIGDNYVSASNISYIVTLPIAKALYSVGLSPQGGGSTVIYNHGSYFKVYGSTNNSTWTLIKDIALVESGYTPVSTVYSPFTGYKLRPHQLVEFII